MNVEAETTYVILGLVAAMYIAWNLGANDAANPTDMAVGSGALSIKKAIILFCIFAALGAVVQGYMVIKTIGKGVVREIPAVGALSASLAAGIWITLATYKGIPVSTTHSTVGAVLGIGLVNTLFFGKQEAINYAVVAKVILSWVTSPLSAIVMTVILYFLLLRLTDTLTSRGIMVEVWYKRAFIPALAFSAYAFGANDVGNATGVYVSVVRDITGIPDEETMRLLSIMGAAGIAVGALTWGPRVIRTVGFGITRMDYVSGLAAQFGEALAVWLFTTVPHMLFGYGMPVSTTHASVSSIIGAGIAKHRGFSGVNWRTVGIILASWILTLPVAAVLSAIIYLFISVVVGL